MPYCRVPDDRSCQPIVPCLVTLFGGLVFCALIVELPFVLDGIGLNSTAAVGEISAAMSLMTAIGAGLSGKFSGLSARVLVLLEFGGGVRSHR